MANIDLTSEQVTEGLSLQDQIDNQNKFSQNVILTVVFAAFLILVTVAIEVIVFHSNGVSEEEYISALENQKEYTELLIDNKLSEYKNEELVGARDTIEPESKKD
jgi:hypothetical protein